MVIPVDDEIVKNNVLATPKEELSVEVPEMVSNENEEDVDIEIPKSFLDKIDKELDGDHEEVKEKTEKAKEPSDFDKFRSDPLNNLYLEFKASGEEDFKGFLEKGGLDFKTPSIEDLIRIELESDGLSGDKLEAALERRLNNYEDLTEGEQEIEVKKLNKTYSTKQKGVLIDYSKSISQEKARVLQIQEKSIVELDQTLNQFVGKKYMNLVNIPDADKDEIRQVAMEFSKPFIDKDGKVTGYDVKNAINLAITHKYGKLAIKEAKKSGYVEAYKEIMKQKKNISSGDSKTQTAKTSDLTTSEALKKLRQM